MKHSSVYALLLFFIFFEIATPVFADEDLKSLKDEIRELKSAVQDLKGIVQTQNERIRALEKPGESKTAQTNPTKTKDEPVVSANENPSPTATTPDDKNYRQMGFWKVPTPQGGAWKLLPDISVIGIFSGAYFTQEPEEHGHDPQRTGFNLQEIELGLQSVIDPYVRADVFLSFHEEGVELEEAYVTTLSLPKGLQVRGGKFLEPFGRQNQKHLENWAFVDDNLVNQIFLGDEQFSELGMEVSYLFPTPFFLQAQFAFSQGTSENNFDGDRKTDFAYTGRLSTSVDVSEHTTALIGSSVAFGYNKTGLGNSTTIVGGDFLLKWKPSPYKGIEWQTEYMYRHRELFDHEESEGGLYSYLLGNWSKRWGAGARVDVMGIPSTERDAYRLSSMVTFRPSEFFRIKAQYEFRDERGQNPVQAAYLQWIFNMGPHGTHQF